MNGIRQRGRVLFQTVHHELGGSGAKSDVDGGEAVQLECDLSRRILQDSLDGEPKSRLKGKGQPLGGLFNLWPGCPSSIA